MTWCEKTANAQLSLQPWSRVAWTEPLPSGALSTYLSHGSWVFRLSVHGGHRVPGPLDPWPQIQWLCVFTTGAAKARVSSCPRENAVSSAPTLGAWRSFRGTQRQVENGREMPGKVPGSEFWEPPLQAQCPPQAWPF